MSFHALLFGTLLLGGLRLCAGEIPVNQPIVPRASGQRMIDSMLAILPAMKDDIQKVNTLCILSHLQKVENIDTAMANVKRAVALCEQLGDQKRLAEELAHLGVLYADKKDYGLAIYYDLRSLRLYESLKEHSGFAMVSNNIGIIYDELGRGSLARQYYEQALRMCMQNDEESRKLRCILYMSLGNAFSAEGKMYEAIDHYKRSQKIAEELGSFYIIFKALGNISETYYDLKKYDSATYYIDKVLHDINKYNDPENYIFALLVKAKIEEKQSYYASAEKRLLEAERLLYVNGAIEKRDEVQALLAKVLAAQGKYKGAYLYMQKVQALKDSSINERIVEQIGKLQKAYEIEKRDKEIQLLSKDKLLAEVAVSKEKTLRNFMLFMLLTFVLFVALALRNLILKHRIKNKVLSAEMARAEKNVAKLLHENAEAKYEVLLTKTNPHFLFNSLSTLSSIIVKNKNRDALEFVERFSELYRLILDAGHHKIVKLKDEMQLVHHFFHLQEVRFAGNVDMEVNIPEDAMEWCVAHFSVQMAVENAIKHNIVAEGKKLNIVIEAEGSILIIRNTLQRKQKRIPSTYTGQHTIAGRYHLLTDIPPEFIQTETEYIVKLPLLHNHLQPV